MTIEERAKEYATKVVGGEYHGGFKGEVWSDRYAIYTEVATSQRTIDIDKVSNAFCMIQCNHPRKNCDCTNRMKLIEAMKE